MTMRHHVTISILAVILLTVQMGLASHFEAAYIEKEPRWAFHPDASLKYENQNQHHTHGLIVFEKIHGVSEHLPFFVVRTNGVYGSIRDRTVQLAEKMDMAMEMITKGGRLFTAIDRNNYAIYVEEDHSRLRVMTVTPTDVKGYALRSNPEFANLTAGQLAEYIVDYWMDMYNVFYRMREPEYLRETEQGKQIIGMMKWANLMSNADGVQLNVETLHDYIDMMPGSRAFKEALESLSYRIPDMHGEGEHGEEPSGHQD